MTLSSLLDEYDLSLDDIRWYLSALLTDSLLMSKDHPDEITRRIWSGALEADLYNMEELYLARLQDEYVRGTTDQQAIRDQFEKARLLKIQRRR
jgi:hypothetical protein